MADKPALSRPTLQGLAAGHATGRCHHRIAACDAARRRLPKWPTCSDVKACTLQPKLNAWHSDRDDWVAGGHSSPGRVGIFSMPAASRIAAIKLACREAAGRERRLIADRASSPPSPRAVLRGNSLFFQGPLSASTANLRSRPRMNRGAPLGEGQRFAPDRSSMPPNGSTALDPKLVRIDQSGQFRCDLEPADREVSVVLQGALHSRFDGGGLERTTVTLAALLQGQPADPVDGAGRSAGVGGSLDHSCNAGAPLAERAQYLLSRSTDTSAKNIDTP